MKYKVIVPCESRMLILEEGMSIEFDTKEEAESVLKEIKSGDYMVGEIIDDWRQVEVIDQYDSELKDQNSYIEETE